MLAAIRAQICVAVRCAASLVLASLISCRANCNHSHPSTFQKEQYPAIYSAAHRRRLSLCCNSLSSPGITTIAPAPSTKSKGYIIGILTSSLIQLRPAPTYSATISVKLISGCFSNAEIIDMDLNPDFISSSFTQSIKSDTPITMIRQSAIRRFSSLVIFDNFSSAKLRLSQSLCHTQKGTFSPRGAIVPFWVWRGISNGSNFAMKNK